MKKSWLFSFPACSSMTLTSAKKRPYWFRTCDIETDLRKGEAHFIQKKQGESVQLFDKEIKKIKYAYMGITYNQEESWLLDGINEAGLAGGLLMLPEATSVKVPEEGYEGCMGMELVTRLLSSCQDVEEVKAAAADLQILDVPYGKGSVPASMHYFFVDEKGKETVLEAADSAKPGILRIYEHKELIGVMTNAPVYFRQLENLSWFMSHSWELRQGLGGRPIDSLDFEGRRIKADSKAWHLSLDGTFPGSYSSYDRFIRLAVLKALNDCGNGFPDDKMLALGSNLMNTVYEPPSRGVFHYSHIEKEGRVVGQKESYTQYLVMYDLFNRSLYIRFMDQLQWQEYSL